MQSHDDSDSSSGWSSSISSVERSSVIEPIFVEDPKEQFTYGNFISNFIEEKEAVLGSSHGEFAASRAPGSLFINFGCQDIITNNVVGWKAHISVDDSDIENLARAWDAIKDIFIDEKLVTKVVIPNAGFYKDPVQFGKQITIYCHATPERDWQDVFNRIENALAIEDIKTNGFSPSDKAIIGSKFISYRK
ncbi:MAG TPA: hypothetical protein VHA13_01750 [Gammaproteobacteria bacterium]|nr:hypothetical protein [Gammaproteobacteria bacterium]